MSRSRIRIGATVAAGAAALTLVMIETAGSAVSPGGPLYGVLLGSKEVAPDGTKRAGDPDARGSASAVIDDGQLCFGLAVKNLDAPVGAHIHKGNPGKNGPIVVTLTAPAQGDPGASSGCVAIDAGLGRAILRNPRKYYWNVHTQAFPGGAIRGQVFTKRR